MPPIVLSSGCQGLPVGDTTDPARGQRSPGGGNGIARQLRPQALQSLGIGQGGSNGDGHPVHLAGGQGDTGHELDDVNAILDVHYSCGRFELAESAALTLDSQYGWEKLQTELQTGQSVPLLDRPNHHLSL
ncbi:hypothetical protein [Azorhizobium sp. AG788]|uniref:hypothetical protein n=1 Tax=Azorhizobium sp. AG788 TaxID=2183897 RepID=UPI00313A3028